MLSMYGLVWIILSCSCLLINGNCPAGKGKSTCITEDLLHMIMGKTGNVDSQNTCTCGKQEVVAFTAILKSHVQASKGGVTLKFQNVKVNTGSFDANTGKFTAPKKGFYHFSCVILFNGRGGGAFDLMKNNNKYLLGAIVSTPYASQTHSFTIDLEKGDQVYIRARGNYPIQANYTYFSGYLL